MKEALAFLVAFAVTFVMHRGAMRILAVPAGGGAAWVAVGAL